MGRRRELVGVQVATSSSEKMGMEAEANEGGIKTFRFGILD